MRRVQIQLDEQTYEAIRNRAFQKRQSVSAAVREILRESSTVPQPKKAWCLEDLTWIGIGHGGPDDRGSIEHDDILGEGRW